MRNAVQGSKVMLTACRVKRTNRLGRVGPGQHRSHKSFAAVDSPLGGATAASLGMDAELDTAAAS